MSSPAPTAPSVAASEKPAAAPPSNPTTQETSPKGSADNDNAQKKDRKQKAKQEGDKKDNKNKPAAAGDAAQTGEKKLSGKELKELKKAEKQAKRAAAKAEAAASGAPRKDDKGSEGKKGGKDGQQQQKGGQKQTQKKATVVVPAVTIREETVILPVKPEKQVGLFRHLYPKGPRPALIAGAIGIETKGGMGVHPAIEALTIQMADYTISGSNARCIATLLAFKEVIEDYVTPPKTTLPRDLISHGISPQIECLVKARPMCVSMKNAIRWLKLEVSTISIDMSDEQAKEYLNEKIDQYIQEKITAAGRVISNSAAEKIRDGDVIVTYAKSSVVQQALLEAHSRGTKFTVVVFDSRPRFEGRNLARTLGEAGVDTQYALITSLAYIIPKATKVFLGAHSMLSNGYLTARIGTALVAMMAKNLSIPVIVCAESIKFSEKVQLDAIVQNERAPEEELIDRRRGGEANPLEDWGNVEGLQMLNLMYDLTPAEYITQVITEFGSLPPSSVPVVHKLSMGQHQI